VSQTDWDGRARALCNFQTTSHIFLTNFFLKWLPVGKKATATTLSHNPLNVHRVFVEDFDHVFRCPDPHRLSRSTLQEMIQFAYRRNSASVEILISSLQYWFLQTPTTPTPHSHNMTP
jgi:hypothetical protein